MLLERLTEPRTSVFCSTTHAEQARNAKEASAIANLKKERQQLHQLEKEKAAIRYEALRILAEICTLNPKPSTPNPCP